MKKLIYLIFCFPILACAQSKIQNAEADNKVIFDGTFKEIKLTTVTNRGTPADRVNLIFEAPTENLLLNCLNDAGWSAADRLSFTKLAREVTDIMDNKKYDKAPVSSLHLFNRKQDLAFEIESGDSPRQRHHIRLWESAFKKPDALIWFVTATFDDAVEWRKLTHRVSERIDEERNFVRDGLMAKNCVESVTELNSVDPVTQKNFISDNKVYLIKLKSPLKKPQ